MLAFSMWLLLRVAADQARCKRKADLFIKRLNLASVDAAIKPVTAEQVEMLA